MHDGFWIIDPLDGQVLDANEAMCRMFGYPRDELLKMSVADVEANDSPEMIAQRIQHILQVGSTQFESRFRRKDGTVFDVDVSATYMPLRKLIFGFHRDITERKQAEQNLELLAQAGRELSTTLNLRTIYTTLHRIIQRAMSCDFVFVSRFSAAEQLIYCDYGSGPRGEFDALTLSPIPLEAEGRGTQSRVIRSGEPLLVNDFAAYLRTTDNTHYVDEDGQLRPDTTEEDDPTRSALIVPLKLEGQVVGVVQVLSSTLAAYVPRDLQFLESLAMPVATALTNAHLFAQLQAELAERQRAQDTLRESEEKFSKAFQHAPILMTLSAVEDGRYLEVNDEFVRVSGFSRAEAIGKTSLELGWLASADRAQILAALREQGRVTALELTLHAKDQHPVSCLYHGELITLNGQLRLLSIAQDITARKQAEAALRESEINYRRLFETLSEGVALNEIIYNDQGEMVDYRVLDVNPAFYTTAQYDGPVVGRLATDLYQLPVEFITAFWREHKERHTVQFTEMISPANGRYALVATSPFANDRFVTSFIDITERKQLEQALAAERDLLEQRVAERTRELAAANVRLQDLDRLKSKFVSEVSHELRTPVTSLSLYLDLLTHGKPEKHAHYLSSATQQAERMKQLIEDILDLSRLERDKADLTLALVDLNAVLEQAVVAQQPRAETAGLSLTFAPAATLPLVRGDIHRLLQVATNLITNAINYTPRAKCTSDRSTRPIGLALKSKIRAWASRPKISPTYSSASIAASAPANPACGAPAWA